MRKKRIDVYVGFLSIEPREIEVRIVQKSTDFVNIQNMIFTMRFLAMCPNYYGDHTFFISFP